MFKRDGQAQGYFTRLESRLTAGQPHSARGAAPGEAVVDDEKLVSMYRDRAQKLLMDKFTVEDLANRFDQALRSRVQSVFLEMLETAEARVPKPVLASAAAMLTRELLGYGPLDRFFADPEAAKRITEIRVVSWNKIRVEADGKWVWADAVFRSEAHCRDVLERILAPTGQRLDIAKPRVSARLLDGSRLMAHIPPASPKGTTFSIRRYSLDMTTRSLLDSGAMTPDVAAFIGACVLSRMNIVFSGGTGTGKTTNLTAFFNDFVPEEESIVTVENPIEMQFKLPDVRQLEPVEPNIEGVGGVTISALIADALRMNPTRILVSECRREEGFDMLQAMNTGHPGSGTTVHADSARLATRRLASMVEMAGKGLRDEAILGMIADALDIVVQLKKERDGRRVVDHVVQVTGNLAYENEKLVVEVRDLVRYDPKSRRWEIVGSLTPEKAEQVRYMCEGRLPEMLELAGVDWRGELICLR